MNAVNKNKIIRFENPPQVISFAAAVGKKEGEGPLPHTSTALTPPLLPTARGKMKKAHFSAEPSTPPSKKVDLRRMI